MTVAGRAVRTTIELGVALASAALLAGCYVDDARPPCAPWTASDASGACVARTWTLPAATDVHGGPSPQRVLATMDGKGRGLVGYGTDNTLEVLEEGEPGEWTVHQAGAAVGGSVPSDLLAGDDGAVVFAWSSLGIVGGTLYLSERDASGSWKEPESPADAISFPPRAYEPRLATNRSGEWLLVWNQYRPSDSYGVATAARASSSDPWRFPSSGDDAISIDVFFSNGPVVAMNDAGQAMVTWYQSLGGPLRAFVSERSGPGAPFSVVTPDDTISPAAGAIDSDPVASVKPAIAADGSAAAAWAAEDNKGSVLVYLATRDRAGVWTSPRDLDDAFSFLNGYARGVQVAFGPRGELYVVWYHQTGSGNAVYAARRRPDGTWAETGREPIRLSTAGMGAIFPRLAIGPDGGAVVVWSEAAGDAPLRVAARRAGSVDEPWGPIEVLSPETGEDALQPTVAMGPGDRAFAVWSQGPSDAQRLMIARCE